MYVEIASSWIGMSDKVIKAILKAEEEAERIISEASIQAEEIKRYQNAGYDENYNKIITSCRIRAEELLKEAERRASDRVKKIMADCEDETARLRALAEKNLKNVVDTVLREIMESAGGVGREIS
jgi:V/A-type H+-transporting ATPase subunit G/H